MEEARDAAADRDRALQAVEDVRSELEARVSAREGLLLAAEQQVQEAGRKEERAMAAVAEGHKRMEEQDTVWQGENKKKKKKEKKKKKKKNSLALVGWHLWAHREGGGELWVAAKCEELEQQVRKGSGSLEAQLQAALTNHTQLTVGTPFQPCRWKVGAVVSVVGGGRVSMVVTCP